MSNSARMTPHIQKQSSESAPKSEDELIQQHASPGTQEALLNSGSLSPSNVLRMQGMVGNQAVQRMLTTRPVVNSKTSTGKVIQRRGTYAPLSIVQAGSANAIEEKEYGSGASIAFTKITSCIGFLARVGDQVFGLHLGVMDANAHNVSSVDKTALADAVGAIWPSGPAVVYQVGMIDNWDGDILKSIYGKTLNGDEMSADLKSAALYSATVNVDGKMEVSKDGVLIYTEPDD